MVHGIRAQVGLLAVTVVAPVATMAMLWLIASGHVGAMQTGDGNACPPADTRCVEARSAFTEMMKVFSHPRCANCHGAFVVTEPSTEHLGEYIPFEVSSGSDDDALARLLDGDADVLYPALRCPECHVFAPAVPFAPPLFEGSWRQPVESRRQMWGGQGPLNVCVALMNFLEGPSALLSHLSEDALIGLGFQGMRGMDEANLMTSPGADPPPLTQAQFVQETQRWLRAMDFGDYFAPADPDQTCAWVTGAAPPPSVVGAPTTAVETSPAPSAPTETAVPTSTLTPTATAAPSPTTRALEAPRITSLSCPATASVNEPLTCIATTAGTVTSSLWAAVDGTPTSGTGLTFTIRFSVARASPYTISLRVCNDPLGSPGGQPSPSAVCATDQRTVTVGAAAAPTSPTGRCPVTGTEINVCVTPNSGPRPNTVRVEGRNIKRLGDGGVPPRVCLYFGADDPPLQLACGAPDAAGTVVFNNVAIPAAPTGRCEPLFGVLSCAINIMDNPTSPTVIARTFYQVTSGA